MPLPMAAWWIQLSRMASQKLSQNVKAQGRRIGCLGILEMLASFLSAQIPCKSSSFPYTRNSNIRTSTLNRKSDNFS
jgi:hypothetical protein